VGDDGDVTNGHANEKVREITAYLPHFGHIRQSFQEYVALQQVIFIKFFKSVENKLLKIATMNF